MRSIPFVFFVLLSGLVLLAKTQADDGVPAEDDDSKEILSTSLKLNDGYLRNITNIVQRAAARKDEKDLNATEPMNEGIARIIVEDETGDTEEAGEALPEAQELRMQRPGSRRRPMYRPSSGRRPPNSNRRNVFPAEGPLRSSYKRPNRRPQEVRDARQPTETDCTFFTKTVCLETINYPHEAIMRSIRGNKEMVSSLLTDYNPQEGDNSDYPRALALESNPYDNRFENNEIKRRSDYPYDNVEEGFTCPSQVMYARPQLARAVSGVWKYIINTGEHTQTLRLEKCSKPKTSCSFISDNYRSSCTQVYNYHRLLTWDNSLGLHMDIFKVPSCCSCHVQGYAELYPPHQKDPSPSLEESFPGADFATDHAEDDAYKRPNSYLTKFKPDNNNNFGTNFSLPPYLEYPPDFIEKFLVSPGGSKPIVDAGTSNRPSFALPGRGRPKKPASSSAIPSRPFDKLPQQHAPNTRAPGYKGHVKATMNRPVRPHRPFRRESNGDAEQTSPAPVNQWFNQQFDQETDASTRLHNGGFDEEYQEPNRRVNYNYHPIIDFFKPEASRLQAPEALASQLSSDDADPNGNSWKPMISQ